MSATLAIPGSDRPARVVRHARAARRLRLDVPGLRGRQRLARRIERAVREAGPGLGVEAVRAEAATGRVMLRYAPGAPLLDALHEAPREPRLRRRRGAREPLPEADWHAMEVAAVLERLGSDPHGLSAEDAARHAGTYGPNTLADEEPRSRLALLAAQADNLPSMLLLGSSAVSALFRDYLDAGAILSAVGLDVALGYGIERRNEGLLAAWQKLEAGEARVLREGALGKVPAGDLALGDVLVVRAGETVPADARVVDAHRLACNESILTGESDVRGKRAAPVDGDAPLAERASMIYSGTTVASGRGRAVVTAIGAGTEAARIRELMRESEPGQTPFERRLDRLSRNLALMGAASGAASAAAGMVRMRPVSQVFGNAVALAVAAIPEGLPVVSTAALVRSMERMREKGMVVRRLVSAETLGGVSVVCADKTGTLTLNEMMLEGLDLGRGMVDIETVRADREKVFDDPPTLALAASVLNSDLELHGRREGLTVSGSPTEKALLAAAEKAGLDTKALFQDFPRRLLRERDHGAQYVLSVHDVPGSGRVAFVKGAPEQVVRLCDRDLNGELDTAGRAKLRERNVALAEDGLRVLALAWRRLDAEEAGAPEALRGGFTLLGLLALRDPLREGAAETVRAAREAGIRTLVLTGDQLPSARGVARAVGLEGEVLEGEEVGRLLESDGPALRRRLAGLAAVARVTPAEKAALVKALREAGEVVAMAGDGVNDAPAIQAADVGIAIGKRASDVSREAADIVLAGEDLASILHAVGEGRVVQDNLRRAVRYLLATNLSETVLALGAAVGGLRDPFTPTRLLWLNLISDTTPAVALALEPADGDVLARPPAPPDAPLVPEEARREVVRDGLWMAGLGAGTLVMGGPAASFSALAGAQLGYALACRAPGAPPDARFTALLGGTAGVHLAGIALPPVRRLLRLPPVLSPVELACFGVGFALPWVTSRAAHDVVVVRRGRPSEETS